MGWHPAAVGVFADRAASARVLANDHPVMRRGLEGFEGDWAVEDDETFNPQACLSPVWDTALAMIALLDSGLAPDHPALVQAARWLTREQVLSGRRLAGKGAGRRTGRLGVRVRERHLSRIPTTPLRC